MNERRRTLLFSNGYKIPTENGVYIESVDHEFYLSKDWDTANTANSIAVVTDTHKFRIALQDAPSTMAMDEFNEKTWEKYLGGTTNSGTKDETKALTDYNGAVNTQLIVEKCQPSSGLAAGWCAAYTFPDGETKGYLPALGEMYLASQYYAAIKKAFSVCGGTINESVWHWSSTFWGVDYSNLSGHKRMCWVQALIHDDCAKRALDFSLAVRPFAVLEGSN